MSYDWMHLVLSGIAGACAIIASIYINKYLSAVERAKCAEDARKSWETAAKRADDDLIALHDALQRAGMKADQPPARKYEIRPME